MSENSSISEHIEKNIPKTESLEDKESLIDQAKKVLEKNWTGKFTRPAVPLYPHQWSWDSAFASIGYSHYDQERAEKELRRLFTGQWKNGMIPHIVYSDQEDVDYFPGPEFWHTDAVPDAPDRPATSGICQPPIHATAVLRLLENSPDRAVAQEFAADIFPKLKEWHDFLYRKRDPQNEGLVYIRHPWSSGQDNSPSWDKALNRIKLSDDDRPEYERTDNAFIEAAERPSDAHYDRYAYLIDFFRLRNYDEEKIRQDECPFMVQDVLFNSVLCQAGRDMAQIAEWLGKDPEPFEKQAHKTARAINKKLWDDNHGIYVSYDLISDEQIEVHMLSGFTPLCASVPSPIRAERIYKYLNTHSFARVEGSYLAVPNYDRQAPGFSQRKYWRGPIWINMNWLLYQGLRRYGYKAYNQLIKESIIKLASEYGFYEYYNPKSGEGYGTKDFSWSAALLIDILHDKE